MSTCKLHRQVTLQGWAVLVQDVGAHAQLAVQNLLGRDGGCLKDEPAQVQKFLIRGRYAYGNLRCRTHVRACKHLQVNTTIRGSRVQHP